jgi:type IV secretion system protein VirB9
MNRISLQNTQYFLSLIGIGLFFSMIPLSLHALEKPRALTTDPRIKVVRYQPNNVIEIQANTFTATHVIFSEEEVIQTIQNGDLGAWTVTVQKDLPNMLFLKPTLVDSNTNMTVITNQRTYYFHLKSHPEANTAQSSIYALHFIYPRPALPLLNLSHNKKQDALNISPHAKQNNWDYSFHGARLIMPLHIFDDGQFTYMQLRPGQPVPAIFAVDNPAGKESVVNYRREKDYLIVQQIAPQFTLRQGRHQVVSVFNNRLIAQLNARES